MELSFVSNSSFRIPSTKNRLIPMKNLTTKNIKFSSFPSKCSTKKLNNLPLGLYGQDRLSTSLSYGQHYKHHSIKETQCDILRAYHHVGLISLAAWHYEQVLATDEKDYHIVSLPNENLSSGTPRRSYCDLRREAAYNLHLIYKRSGAHDLARQVLRDYCTF